MTVEDSPKRSSRLRELEGQAAPAAELDDLRHPRALHLVVDDDELVGALPLDDALEVVEHAQAGHVPGALLRGPLVAVGDEAEVVRAARRLDVAAPRLDERRHRHRGAEEDDAPGGGVAAQHEAQAQVVHEPQRQGEPGGDRPREQHGRQRPGLGELLRGQRGEQDEPGGAGHVSPVAPAIAHAVQAEGGEDAEEQHQQQRRAGHREVLEADGPHVAGQVRARR